MSAQVVETLIARLLVDDDFRSEFLDDPQSILDAWELDAAERAALLAIDRPGLGLASRSIAEKKAQRHSGWLGRIQSWIRRGRPPPRR